MTLRATRSLAALAIALCTIDDGLGDPPGGPAADPVQDWIALGKQAIADATQPLRAMAAQLGRDDLRLIAQGIEASAAAVLAHLAHDMPDHYALGLVDSIVAGKQEQQAQLALQLQEHHDEVAETSAPTDPAAVNAPPVEAPLDPQAEMDAQLALQDPPSSAPEGVTASPDAGAEAAGVSDGSTGAPAAEPAPPVNATPVPQPIPPAADPVAEAPADPVS